MVIDIDEKFPYWFIFILFWFSLTGILVIFWPLIIISFGEVWFYIWFPSHILFFVTFPVLYEKMWYLTIFTGIWFILGPFIHFKTKNEKKRVMIRVLYLIVSFFVLPSGLFAIIGIGFLKRSKKMTS